MLGWKQRLAPSHVNCSLFHVNRSVASGRLTRCWGKDNRYRDDHDPNDNVDRDPLKLSLVHWHSPPFREGSELTAVPPQRPQVTIVPPEFVRTKSIVHRLTAFVKLCRENLQKKSPDGLTSQNRRGILWIVRSAGLV